MSEATVIGTTRIYPCSDNDAPVAESPCRTTDWAVRFEGQGEWPCTGSMHVGPYEVIECDCPCHARVDWKAVDAALREPMDEKNRAVMEAYLRGESANSNSSEGGE